MKTFEDALRTLLDCFPRFDLTQEQAATWKAVMADADPEALIVAAIHLSRESSYPPSIAEWLARAETASGSGAAHVLTAAEAWAELMRNRRAPREWRRDQDGATRMSQVRWSSEAVRRAAEVVAWNDQDWLTEQLPTIRAQFERYYNAIKDRQDNLDSSGTASALLPGVMRAIGRGGEPRRLMDGAP